MSEPIRSRAARPTQEIADLFVGALKGRVEVADCAGTALKPFDMEATAPLPQRLRVYVYRTTTHVTERQEGAYKTQITLTEAANGHFDWSRGAFVILAGYEPTFEVFTLWDAACHDTADGIPQSKSVQVHQPTLLSALAAGIATQERELRGAPAEMVISARPDRLYEALIMRWHTHIETLTKATS